MKSESAVSLAMLSRDSALNQKDRDIIQQIKDGERIDDSTCLYLFEHNNLGFLGAVANQIREARHGSDTYFNRNFHVEPTNVCIYTCSFCSYSRLIKKRAEGWEYTEEEIMEIVRSFDDQPVTEIHLVGGVLPQYDLDFYGSLFQRIKQHRPELHIKALTPVEYHYIFRKAKISYEAGMQIMKDAGLDSLPGGGAEIFHPEIREKIAGDKCNAKQWLEIHEIWHGLGGRSNATMLYGHIESYKHRIHHMQALRELQDRTGGFQTFIPLKFRNKGNEMSHIDETSIIEDLKNYAVSRIYLDNFAHLKAYWPMIGRTTAQIALSYGVDDVDGTIDDTTKIYSMAGAEEQNPSMSTQELVELIRQSNRRPVERNTLYQVVTDYTDVSFEDHGFRGYMDLPVVNN
ncbi:MAG: CofH family radical SAM protein [Saprospiraceae bacterium]|nr:CofH family radical SAM protein [Saprospiraceae bacterium]